MNNIFVIVNGQELKATIINTDANSDFPYEVQTLLGTTWVTAQQLIFKS